MWWGPGQQHKQCAGPPRACAGTAADAAHLMISSPVAAGALGPSSAVLYPASCRLSWLVWQSLPSACCKPRVVGMESGDLLRAGPPAVQAGLVYRAIDMNMRLHRWTHALQLATQHKVHQDLVLLRRQQFLAGIQRPETDSHFLQLAADCTVDPQRVEACVQQELQKEAERPGAVRYV